MEAKDFLGWASSLILLVTLIQQVYKQWKEGTGEGVSKLLFAGQVFASIGFTIYSYLVGNWIFTITNAVLLVNNFIGLGLTFYLKRKNKDGKDK